MEDIIETMPWTCGGADGCTQLWHKRNYWAYSDGTYSVDEYSDGDHEPIEESELPAPEEVNAAWLEYYRYVADTGMDPIGEFMVKHQRVRNERWQFRFNRSILGVVVVQGKHAGKLYSPREFPAHVVEYLNLKSKSVPKLQDFQSSKDFEAAGLRFNVWVVQHVEHCIQRDPGILVSELKKLARKAIAFKAKQL